MIDEERLSSARKDLQDAVVEYIEAGGDSYDVDDFEGLIQTGIADATGFTVRVEIEK